MVKINTVMKWLKSALAILLILNLFLFGSPSSAADQDKNIFAQDRILVKFKTGISEVAKRQLESRFGDSALDVISRIGVRVIKVPAGKVNEHLKSYRAEKNIQFAEPDYIVKADIIPDDPSFSYQWGLTKIQAPEAWDVTTGSATVNIAILDTGIDQDHEDLAVKIVANQNYSTSNTTDDLYGHGTHVAGIAAAITNNGIGISGIGYNSALMNIKVLDDTGNGYNSSVADGIIWATDHGAKVINMSFTGSFASSTLENAVNYAWDNGVVVVAAAGNNNVSTPFYPAAFTNAIAVAATDPADVKAYFSNYGNWVDVAAPGVNIFSTLPNHGSVLGTNYGYLDGTSMSTPFVSGLAALIWATPYGTNNALVRERIESQADPVDGTGTYWQYGRINAYKSVTPAPVVTTNFATSITAITARLNGTLASLGTASSNNVSFQWGLVSGNYTANTASQTVSTNGTFSADITNLTPDMTYFFRAEAIGNGTASGAEKSFTTAATDYGLLRVQTIPPVPTTISIDGIIREGWGLNWVKIPVGSYSLSLSDVPGFTTPTQVSVTLAGVGPTVQPLTSPIMINSSAITEVIANFTQLGNMKISTSPPVPATVFVDDQPMDDWGNWTYLASGNYSVSFEPLDGFITPDPIVATVTAGVTTYVTGNYTEGENTVSAFPHGLLRVQTSPPVPTTISIDGIPREGWGLNWVKMAPGSYLLQMSGIPGFITPTSISVRQGDAAPVIQPLMTPITITDGIITEVQIEFVEQGNLRVETSPPVPATIYVDGQPMDNWGCWTYLDVGYHTVSFGSIVGFLTPQPLIVWVGPSSTATTHVIGDYNTGQSQIILDP
jgi:thermitase